MKSLDDLLVIATVGQRELLRDAWYWLGRDTWRTHNRPHARWLVESFARSFEVTPLPRLSGGRTALGMAVGGGRVLLGPDLFTMHPAAVASVLTHEASHLRWAAEHGSSVNSPAEELDCLREGRDFLLRVGQDASWLEPEIERVLGQLSGL